MDYASNAYTEGQSRHRGKKEGSMTHELKTLAPYWDAVASGDKTFEVRHNDRGFQRGDTLVLTRYSGGSAKLAESGWSRITATVTYVLAGGQFGIDPEFVVMGIKVESIV